MAARKKATAKATGNGKKKTGKKTTQAATKKNVSLNLKTPLSKSGIIKAMTDMTELSRKDAVASFEAMSEIIGSHIKGRGPGKFIWPQMLKIVVIKKAARPARKGINPFTGEETMFKAKPAHKVVKIKALKKLKEMVD